MEPKYIRRWTENGFIAHFIGEFTFDLISEAQKERDADERIKTIDFTIVDFTFSSPEAADLYTAHARGREDVSTWTKNTHLHMLLVSNSEVFHELFNAYQRYMQALHCPWQITQHRTLGKACDYVNEQFSANLSIKDWTDLPERL